MVVLEQDGEVPDVLRAPTLDDAVTVVPAPDRRDRLPPDQDGADG